MSSAVDLRGRADELGELLERHFIDERGLLRYNLDVRTLRPFTDEQLAGCNIGLIGATPAGRWTYEDTMFITGIYLWALTERALATGDPEPRAIAARVFDDLQPLFAENDRIDPGYIGKPWGGIPQRHTTIDQTFYLCFGLHRFCEVADQQRQRRAAQIIAGNVDWWMRRDYCDFDHTPGKRSNWLSPSHGSATRAQVFLAYLHTRDQRYLDECERLDRDFGTDQFPCRRSGQWGPVDDTGCMTRRAALWHHAMALALWTLARHDPDRRQWWLQRFADQWHKELKLGLEPDGLARLTVRVSLASEREVPVRASEAGYIATPDLDAYVKMNLGSRRWIGDDRSGYFAAHVAASAVLLAEAAPWMTDEVAPLVCRVLHGVGPQQMTWAMDPLGGQLPPGCGHWTQSLTSKGITAWLAAYWQARRLNLLESSDSAMPPVASQGSRSGLR